MIDFRDIDCIHIHCTATPKSRTTTEKDLYDWHVIGNGWSDVGYNFLIQKHGEVVNLRDINKTPASIKGMNDGAIAICFDGGYDNKAMTIQWDMCSEHQLEAFNDLHKDLSYWYNDDVLLPLKFHYEHSSKSCPNFTREEFNKALEKI